METARRFAGKVALVTGASGGLGRACALRLAREGARIAVHYHASGDAARQTLALLEQQGGSGVLVTADNRDRQSVHRAVASVIDQLGRIDVLVNNAGRHRLARSLEQDQPDWDDLIGRNLSGTFFFAQAAAKHMIAARGGHIVNVASKMATSTAPSNAAYCAAKAGIVALTQVLAAEWARHGIRVNCVAPGVLATDVEEIAAAIAFVASGEADFLTGSTLMIDGGWTSYGDYSGWGMVRSLMANRGQG